MNKDNFTYKWGNEVREAILNSYPYIKDRIGYPTFLIYAFDIMLKDDVEGMSKIVAAIINDNPAMVVKVKNNPKLSSWFVGQIMKQTKDYDPKNLLDEINKQLEN